MGPPAAGCSSDPQADLTRFDASGGTDSAAEAPSDSQPRTDAPQLSDAAADSSGPDSFAEAQTEAGSACPPLSTYVLTKDIELTDIPQDGSGITWDHDTGTFFVVANLQNKMWEYDGEFTTVLRTISLSDMNSDTEGLEYMEDGWLAICSENNYVYVVPIGGGVTSVSGAVGGFAGIPAERASPP